MKNILLLEDDLSAALDIELIVSEIGKVNITRVSNLEDADLYCASRQPDAIIADLYLDHGVISLDWLENKTRSIPTIILTSNYSDDYYQKAKFIDARAYLMKPVNPVTLRYELERMLITPTSHTAEKVIIKDGTKLHVFSSKEISWIKTEGNYSSIQTDTKKFVIKTSLLKIINQLKDDYFIRVHRSAVVSINKIKLIDSNAETIELTDGSFIPLGKTYKSEVKRRMKDRGIIL